MSSDEDTGDKLSRLETAMNHLQDTIVDYIAQEVEAQTRQERLAIAKEKREMNTILETAKKSNWLNRLSSKFSTELEQ